MLEDHIALSVREAAAKCNYSPENIRRAIQEGKLIASRPGGKGDYRILVEDLREWLRGTGQPRVDRPAPRRAAGAA